MTPGFSPETNETMAERLKIIQITPGAGGMFCGGCFRDNALVAALRKQGHEVLMIPLYLPLTLDEADQTGGTRTFFNGINVYLDQKSAFFRKAPAWLHRLVGSRRLLDMVARFAVKTRPEDVGDLTLSMLQGETGNQARELQELIDFLRENGKPDAVVLSNALMIGMVRRLRESLGVPVIVTLQGEDYFLNSLPPEFKERCWEELAARSKEADLFISPSRYYGEVMMKYFGSDTSRLRVVPNGINLEGYEQSATPPSPPVLGYFARMCEEKGLALLVDTFLELKRRKNIPAFKLLVGGGCGPSDELVVAKMRDKLRAAGVLDAVEFHKNLTREEKIRFFQKLTVFCTPALLGETFGLYVIEAMAAGVPVVQPNIAAFPELIETAGGHLAAPDPASLADAIEPLLRDPARAHAEGARSRARALEAYGVDLMARNTAGVYSEAAALYGGKRLAPAPATANH